MRLAVIPARGGSKRIPRKNIRHFLGQPIIAYSIRAALDAALFDKVIVSTDDEEIAETARRFGAEVPFLRPPALADDLTGTNAVVRHALSWFTERGEDFEQACCIYATAPFVQPGALRAGLELLQASGKAFAFSVTSFPFPIQRAIRFQEDGAIVMFQPEHARTRSQDLEEAWHDAGQFYWGSARSFVDDVPLLAGNAMPVKLPRHLVQDIDTLQDWTRAEFMYRALQLAGDIAQ